MHTQDAGFWQTLDNQTSANNTKARTVWTEVGNPSTDPVPAATTWRPYHCASGRLRRNPHTTPRPAYSDAFLSPSRPAASVILSLLPCDLPPEDASTSGIVIASAASLSLQILLRVRSLPFGTPYHLRIAIAIANDLLFLLPSPHSLATRLPLANPQAQCWAKDRRRLPMSMSRRC